jgi:hypothetical protein
MRTLRLFYWAVGALIIICPSVSLAQITYEIDASAPYSYVSGTNSIDSWVGNADDGYFDLSLDGFDFQFYGVSVTTLRISTNGYMTFGAEEGREFNHSPIPYSAPPNALIAPFWADFDLAIKGQVRWGIFGTPPSRQLVVEWLDVPFYVWPSSDFSFEAILYETTDEIKFQYLNVVSGTLYDQGSYATVGLENFDGTLGSQFSYNAPSLNNDLAITFLPKLTTVFLDDFSTDKGWTGYQAGGWERRDAVAGAGEHGNPDPGVDHSVSADNYILGYAIGGDYPNDLAEKSIVSPPINCTDLDQVYLKFWRYLNIESNSYDHAKILVSNDGVNWNQFWENPVFDVTDNQWTQVVFDISSIAANQETVYIKFTMGPTNATGRYSGWNIDDLEVTSNYSGLKALYVPSINPRNPNTEEMLIQAGLGITHSTEVPGDLSDYNILILGEEGACRLTTAESIKNFVMTGGGAIIMNSTPRCLAGDTNDLSSIKDWFGAGSYGNDGGYGIVVVPNPFGTDLLVDDKVDYAITASAVYDLEPDVSLVSKWASDGAHSFSRRFGQGRLFYYAGNPGYSQDPDPIVAENGLMLFEAGISWAIGCIAPIIASQPNSQTIQSGQTASIWVNASGTIPLSYQWYEGSSGDTSNPIMGATISSYTTPPLTQAKNYWVRVTNACGVVDSDTAMVTVTVLPMVTIVTTVNTATEEGPTTGTFTVSREGSTSNSLTVYYNVSGTATAGDDYVSLAGSVVIPSGSSYATITVTPTNDGLVESDETVIVTLNADPAYIIGSPSSGTVTIISDNVNVKVKLTFPNGGEFLPSGSPQTIEWQAPTNATTFRLKYSLDNGLTWRLIADNLFGTSHEWIIPTPSNNKKACLVKLVAYDSSHIKVGTDKSDGPFRIEVVKLTSLNDNETLTSGIAYPITWATNGTAREVASVVIRYTTDGGVTWKKTGTETGNPGTHSWTPSVVMTKTKCKAKVILKDKNGFILGRDVSDNFFTIIPAQ